jgi:FlgD Ig-like domain
MSHATAKNWGSAVLLILTVALVAVEAPAQMEKVLPEEAVLFQVGHAEGVFIEGTTTEASRQEAVLPCSFAVFGEFAPSTVNTIQLKVTYTDSLLEFVDWSADDFGNLAPEDVYWGVAPDVIDSTPGLLIISLTGDVQPTSTEQQEFIYLKFRPRCQEELSVNPVTIEFGFSESFIFGGEQFSDPGDPARNGSVTVADYDGFLALNDFDPYDEEPSTIVLQGTVGEYTEIEVPMILSTNADVSIILTELVFDESKLMPVAYEAGGPCHYWLWANGGAPPAVDGTQSILIGNYPDAETDDEVACQIVNITFSVLGDWRGQSTQIAFSDSVQTQLSFGVLTSPCDLVNPDFDQFGVTVVMEAYETTVTTIIDDMIYPTDAPTKNFIATVQATNNFHIGGDSGVGDKDTAPIRLDFDLAADMVLVDVYQPDLANPDPANPLDEFYFMAGANGEKSLDWDVELYSVPKVELSNQRSLTPDFTNLVEMELAQLAVTQPAAFDDYRVEIGYLCAMEDRPARVLDAITDSLETTCWTGLTFAETPYIDYAVGELYCVTRTSTRPASVVQEYWARSSFDLTDFRVRVNKSGSHIIADINPADGVIVVESGSDYVIFGNGPTWVPAVHTTRLSLGTITYNAYPAIAVISSTTEGDAAEKGVAPPVTWCWKWTSIAFDPSSYLHAANGQDPYMYISQGNVGTRWNCSPIVNPEPLPMPKDGEGLPEVFALTGNFPNPFNPRTVIRFDVPATAHVTLEVMNVQGRRIATLIDGTQSAGRHEVPWNGLDQSGRRVASGVYFSVMRSGDFLQKSKMVLLK